MGSLVGIPDGLLGLASVGSGVGSPVGVSCDLGEAIGAVVGVLGTEFWLRTISRPILRVS